MANPALFLQLFVCLCDCLWPAREPDERMQDSFIQFDKVNFSKLSVYFGFSLV